MIYRTEQLILQSTPLCNLNCSYCYIPEWSRSRNEQMSLRVIEEVFEKLLEADLLTDELDVRWHAGEPMVLSTEYYSKAFATIDNIVKDKISICHSFQTNATLITKEWCDFFSERQIRLGVSIDGPEEINDQFRKTKGGGGTFKNVIRGISRLKEYKVPFEIIAVINAKSLEEPRKVIEFLMNLEPEKLSFNIEESECDHESEVLQKNILWGRYKKFLEEANKLSKKRSIPVRELDEIRHSILYGDGDPLNLQCKPYALVTVDFEGNIYTYSPELAGMSHEQYPTFHFGNIFKNDFKSILSSEKLKRMRAEVDSGVHKCRTDCEYFEVCGGGAPGNKLFENGSFSSSETGYCIARYQIPTNIILHELEELDFNTREVVE